LLTIFGPFDSESILGRVGPDPSDISAKAAQKNPDLISIKFAAAWM
jgi:hypothetical protein